MAATWLKPIKKSKTMGKRSSVAAIIDYVENPQKTDNGRLIRTYACGSRTADNEFLLAKQEYERKSKRGQGKKNVIAYNIRQSFLPGEVTPEEANRIGYELAMRFTKGQHSLIVCTHIDKAHVHNHIIFNSTTIDCERKFKNFFRSSFAVRHISDLLCAENGLSIIENPQPPKENYGDWLGDKKKPTNKDILKRKIDEIVPQCETFEDFMARLIADGYEVNASRKHISVKGQGWGKASRLDTLKGDHTEAAIRARIASTKTMSSGGESPSPQSGSPQSGGRRVETPNGRPATASEAPSLLIDIQAKIAEGKGAGYAHWAKIFNLKESAKTLVFLKENGIDSYEDLKKKSSSASGEFAALTKRIKDIESRQKDIAELQKQIGTYGKTRDIYAKYKASGWSRDFYDIHAADIILHRAAKKHFDALGMKKLPSINQLKQEYATLAAERKKLYGGYHSLKDKSRELAVACANAERILGITPGTQIRDATRSQYQRGTHAI